MCGPTTLAMLASYIRNETITPADIATEYSQYDTADGYSWQLFDESAPELGLDVIAKLNGGFMTLMQTVRQLK